MNDNVSEYRLLEQITKYANSLIGPDNTILTVDSFLLAILNIITGEEKPDYIEPLNGDVVDDLKIVCEYYNFPILASKKHLNKCVPESFDPIADEDEMDRIFEYAHKLCKIYKQQYISPLYILTAILQNPTENVKFCLDLGKKFMRDNRFEHKFYKELMEKANTICSKTNGISTPETFLLAVCNLVEEIPYLPLNTPADDVKCAIFEKLIFTLNKYKISALILKPLLIKYLDEAEFTDTDFMHMNFYILHAANAATQSNNTYPSPELMLDTVLKHHTSINKELFEMHNEHYEIFNDSSYDFSESNCDEDSDYFDSVDLDALDKAKAKAEAEAEAAKKSSSSSEISKVMEIKTPTDSVNTEQVHKDFKLFLSNAVYTTKSIQENLSSTVFGQDNAINTFASAYYQAMLRGKTEENTRKPFATFLFAGPPGVGKTFLAETIAEELNLPFKRFDMSEYCDKESNLEFCGSDKVYKNGKAGNFTSFVAENPNSIVLFDEIEKAHSVIINLFLQMLDAGVIRDNYTDKEISLKNVLMIFTTNAGKQLYEENEFGDYSAVSRKVILKALQDDINPRTGTPFFPAAICSRFASGNVVMFNHITPHNLLSIAKREIEKSASRLEENSGIKFEFDERIYASILFSEGGNADARTIKNRANTIFNNELFEFLKLISCSFVDKNVINLESMKISVDLPDDQPEITELFEHQGDFNAIVFSSKLTANSLAKKSDACSFLCARTIKEANNILRKNDISFILVDLNQGADKNDDDYLNIGDEDSEARDFIFQLREEDATTPIYILQTKKHTFSNEEKKLLSAQGIRGFIDVNNSELDKELHYICRNIYEQQRILSLARANKVLSFETAQKISEDGKSGEIILMDFKLKTAIEANDSKNILSNVSKPDVKFDNVIGAEDAKQELEYFVEYLKNPKKYVGTGVKVPKGVLLYGPPGTGKTMLAKAMAGESDLTFICAEGNQFLKSTVGAGSEAIHSLFRTARKYAPAILFIDEIDAIAKERTGTGNAEDTLTALLTEMDGFKNQTAKPVFVLAATNFDIEAGSKKSLDPALMRRFDRRIYVDLPNRNERVEYMSLKLKSNSAFNISDELLENLAIRSTGMSLADLESIFELALRMVIRSQKTKVTDDVLEEAFETFTNGEKKHWNHDTLLRVARHEAGHALICYESGETPSYITVVPRGDHGGYMQHNTDEGKHIFTKKELLTKIRTALGGRAAEIVYYGKENGVSTGASGDLLTATSLARHMVELYGMDDDYGLTAFLSQNEASQEMRACINKILVDEMNNAIKIIEANKKYIDKLSETLINKNHISSKEINNILKKKTL